MTSVWPALCPPWKRTTMSACSESQSTILPLPSSPHWEPTTTTFAIVLAAPHVHAHAESQTGRCTFGYRLKVAEARREARKPRGSKPQQLGLLHLWQCAHLGEHIV